MEKKGNRKVVDQINKLKKISKFGKTDWRESPSAAVKVFYSGKETVSFLSAGVLNEFDSITSSLYLLDRRVQSNYTLEDFIKELINLLRVLNKEDREVNNSDWNILVNNLIERPDIEVEIAFPIYGILLDNDSIELGDFKIYGRKALTNKYSKTKNYDPSIINSDYYLSQNVIAKSIDKCREDAEKNIFLRNELEKNILSLGTFFVNGTMLNRLPNTSNICFKGTKADGIIVKLKNMALATGSACNSAIAAPSHVLKAMNLSDADAYSSIRFSLGKYTSPAEINLVITELKKIFFKN